MKAAAAAAAATAEGQPTTPAALMVQQGPDLSQLPSLVIFERCCYFWAEQLQQQMLMLLQPGLTGTLQQGELARGHRGNTLQHMCAYLGPTKAQQPLVLPGCPAGWGGCCLL
jgi:hypothetical protein